MEEKEWKLDFLKKVGKPSARNLMQAASIVCKNASFCKPMLP